MSVSYGIVQGFFKVKENDEMEYRPNEKYFIIFQFLISRQILHFFKIIS